MSDMNSVSLIAEKIKKKQKKTKEETPNINNFVAKHSQGKSGAGKMGNRNKDLAKGASRKQKHKKMAMENISEAVKAGDTIKFHDVAIGQTPHDVKKITKLGKITVAILNPYGKVNFVAVATNGESLDGNKSYDNPNVAETATTGIRNATKMYNAAVDAVKKGSENSKDIIDAAYDGIGGR